MTESERWKEIFTTETLCDFCQDERATIMRVTVHPVYELRDGDMIMAGISLAKKCEECCEIESGDYDFEEE